MNTEQAQQPGEPSEHFAENVGGYALQRCKHFKISTSKGGSSTAAYPSSIAHQRGVGEAAYCTETGPNLIVTGDRTFKSSYSSSNADAGKAVYCTDSDTGPNLVVTGDRTFYKNADVGEAVYCTDTGPNNGDVMVMVHHACDIHVHVHVMYTCSTGPELIL